MLRGSRLLMEDGRTAERQTFLSWTCRIVLFFAVAACMRADDCCGDTIKSLSKASTSRAAKEDAIHGIPFRNLSVDAQQRIASVVRKPTMFRRMPITAIECDPEMHRFSVRHPEVIVGIWQLMGITQVKAQRIAPYVLKCDDGVGTVTDMELIYGDSDTHIIFCEGSYDGPLFRKPLTGRCVLVLKSGAKQNGSEFQITNMLDVFLQIDHAGIDIFAKTLHPLLGKSADVNFIESMKFVSRMSDAAETNGQGMQHMAGRLKDLDPDVNKRFREVVSNVNARHAQMVSQPVKTSQTAQTTRRTAAATQR